MAILSNQNQPKPCEESSCDSPERKVLTKIQGCAGVITLNRPQSLNSLDLPMIETIHKTLREWAHDDRIAFVIVEGAGDRAFCAGGDIRSVYQARLEENLSEIKKKDLPITQGGRAYMDRIFREEYRLNYLISQYPKPYISLIHGICMGGGMGLSVHGSHRIVTDTTLMAMPESGIGFFTDVGASYFLNQAPGKIGLMMGLTGERLAAVDCLHAGLATHYVSQEKWSPFRESLIQSSSREEAFSIIDQLSLVELSSELSVMQDEINFLFGAETLNEVIKTLELSKNPKAYEWLKAIDVKSPTSLKVIFDLLKKTRRFSVKKCLALEFRLSQRFVEQYDFFEGIRSVLIDKDNRPNWQPSRLEEVKVTTVRAYFSPLGSGRELDFEEC
jgi:enoyl-CoA hydratase/3-hydroxyisobutyryl-CoA hydrolase